MKLIPEKKITAPDTRNYGIDLLKILAMFMVVVLHVMGVGGVLNHCIPLSLNYEISWIIETLSYCAVNCFAMASGFVMVNAKFKYHRIAVLWLQVVFLSVVLAAVFSAFIPQAVETGEFLRAFMPVGFNRYWYFTAYFGMFFFIPFFNHLLNTLSRKDTFRLVVTIVIVLSVFPALFNKDVFTTGLGYSVLWISALYMIGGYCKKYSIQDNYAAWKALLLYIGAVLFSWGIKHLISFTDFHFLDGSRNVNVLIQYTSPTMLLAAFSLLVLFAKMNIRNKAAVALIRLFAPLSFSVYIIHTNPLVWNNLLTNAFKNYSSFSSVILVLSVLGTALGIYLLCSLVDWVRLQLFRILRVNQWCMVLTDKIHKLLTKVLPIG